MRASSSLIDAAAFLLGLRLFELPCRRRRSGKDVELYEDSAAEVEPPPETLYTLDDSVETAI